MFLLVCLWTVFFCDFSLDQAALIKLMCFREFITDVVCLPLASRKRFVVKRSIMVNLSAA